MAEDDEIQNDEQAETEKGKRQAGDGNVAKQSSRSAKGSATDVVKENKVIKEQASEKKCIHRQEKETIIEPVVKKSCSEDPSTSMKSTLARAGLSSQQHVRQQFRLLHSQELIRRILQSTGVLPNNVAQKTSSGLYNPDKTEDKRDIDVKPAEETFVQTIPSQQTASVQDGEHKSSEEVETKGQRPKEFCANSLESVKHRNEKENKTEKCKKEMDGDISFVCSVCSCKQDERGDMESKDELLNVSEESCLSNAVVKAAGNDQGARTAKHQMAIASQNATVGTSKVHNTGSPNVEELSERLHKQPSHEMLDEILKLLQNQAQTHVPIDNGKDENQNTIKKSIKRQTNAKEHLERLVMDASLDDEDWKEQQQQKFLMMGTRPNLREKHSRQLADMKNYYESEIEKLRDQLENLRGNLSSLQQAIPVKMLEAANQKLETRCHLMEEIANELKRKFQKLEQTNEELEKSCYDLRQTNEGLEMRCIFLQKSLQDMEGELSEIQNRNNILESKVLHLTQVNEVSSKNCKQLEESTKIFETTCKQLEESNEKLEGRYRKCKEDNLKLSANMRDLQGSLQTSRKHAQEQEYLVASLENEKNDWILKLDLAQKMAKGSQKRYEEVKIERIETETIAKTLEEQLGILTLSCENAAKAKVELEKNAERDRELLKRLLTEYDALVKENQKLKDSIGSLTKKSDISQDEITDLRGTITTLINRNCNLEESLKEALSRSTKSTPDLFMSGPRKTWDSPGQAQYTTHPSLSSFDSIFDGKGAPDKDDLSGVHVIDTSQKEQSSTPSSVKFVIPWGTETSTPTKNIAKWNLEKPTNIKSPNNLVLKKSDLVTRFDVVFEDSVSGMEVKRSHTGRTSRAQGESPTSIFVSNSATDVTESSPSSRMVSNAAEAALSALKSGRVVSQADWEGRDTKNAKGRRDKSSERKKIRQSQSANSENVERNDSDAVSKLERKFSSLTEERNRLESTLSRIPTHRVTKRSKDDKAFLEKRLDEVIQDVGSVRMQLRQHHAL